MRWGWGALSGALLPAFLAGRVPHLCTRAKDEGVHLPPLLLWQVAAQALDFASERLSQVQTVQVFAQQEREAAAFARLSDGAYEMSRKYALFQVGAGHREREVSGAISCGAVRWQ